VQVNLDFNDDDENRVLLLVHDTKPPFLAGQVLSGKATGVVLPLKDPTSDMAVIARWAVLLALFGYVYENYFGLTG
jgi:pre-mRNA-splicing factor ATP-dependent RNA helicase DHX38/PRP16